MNYLVRLSYNEHRLVLSEVDVVLGPEASYDSGRGQPRQSVSLADAQGPTNPYLDTQLFTPSATTEPLHTPSNPDNRPETGCLANTGCDRAPQACDITHLSRERALRTQGQKSINIPYQVQCTEGGRPRAARRGPPSVV